MWNVGIVNDISSNQKMYLFERQNYRAGEKKIFNLMVHSSNGCHIWGLVSSWWQGPKFLNHHLAFSGTLAEVIIY